MTDSPDRGRSDAAASLALIARLARALHENGAPAHRLEDSLRSVSERLGYDGHFFSTPTSIIVTIESEAGPLTRLERVDPGGLNLERLTEIDHIIASPRVDDVASLRREVDRLLETPPRYGALRTVPATALVTGGAACVFGGGWIDVLVAALVGLVVGVVTAGFGRMSATNRLVDLAGAVVTGFLAHWAATLLSPAPSPLIVMIAALIPLIPGLNLTMAINEIASRHLVSGSARFAGTMVVFVTLAVGIALGGGVASRLFGELTSTTPDALPLVAYLGALVAGAIGFGILFQARPRDVPWILAGAAIAMAGTLFLPERLGPELAALTTAFAVGVAGNLFGRLRNRPAAIIHVPGLILLVPGSVGFRAVTALVQTDTLDGVQAAFSALMIAVSLVTGLLLASALVPSRRLL